MIAKYGPQSTPTVNSVRSEIGRAGDTADEEDEPAWNKAKLEMLAKHISVQSSRDRELQRYRCVSGGTQGRCATALETTDAVSKAVFVSSTTSRAWSEGVFSVTGRVVKAKRSLLAPEMLTKLFSRTIMHIYSGMMMTKYDRFVCNKTKIIC